MCKISTISILTIVLILSTVFSKNNQVSAFESCYDKGNTSSECMIGGFEKTNQSDAGLTKIEFVFNRTGTLPGDSREVAVAFHSLYFIDSYGTKISDEIIFDKDYNLGPGWFAAEHMEIGRNYRWAGGIEKKADLDINIPAGAEGMVLKILSIQDSLKMDVKI